MDEQAAKKIESVKAYYQQQVAQLRSLTQQLTQPDLPPAKRAQLSIQQENLQRDLSVFVENVLKPLAAASASNKDSPRLPPPTAARPPSVAPGIRPPPPTQVRPPFSKATPQPHSVQAIQQQQWLFSQRVQNSRQFNDAFYTQPRSLSRTEIPYTPRPVEEEALGDKTAPLVTEGEMRPSRTLEQLVAKIAAERGVPPPQISAEFEQRALALADSWIDRVSMSAALLARHRNASAIGKRDLELALDRAAGQSQPSAQAILLNVRKVLKRPTTGNNPHLNRMAQLRKHLIKES